MKVEELLEVRECGVCKEALHVFRVTKGDEDRVVAREVASGKDHVCFELPQDANLLVLED